MPQPDTFLLGHVRSVVFCSCWSYFGFHRALSTAGSSCDPQNQQFKAWTSSGVRGWVEKVK